MAGSVVTYYRNYNSSDDTLLRRANPTILSPEALGFSPPEGMLFDSWNTQRDGSGTTRHAGDGYVEQTPVLYAIWAVDADVVVSYDGSVIASLDASGTKTLLTSGKYCEDDITIDYVKPSAPAPNLQAKSNISPTLSSQTITADNGYDGLSSVQINAMPAGSATTPATTITVHPSASVVDNGANALIYATVSATQSITPSVSEGYVASGTAGTVTVSGSSTSILPSKAATTYTPTTTDQTIAYGQYLIGAQTIKGDANLLAENIKKDVSIFGVTGTFEGSGGGGVQTAYVTDVAAADVLYYTDANMTFQSGGFIDDAYLPLGTIVFVHDDGPSIPIPPTGLTQRAQFTSGMHKYTVYEVTG